MQVQPPPEDAEDAESVAQKIALQTSLEKCVHTQMPLKPNVWNTHQMVLRSDGVSLDVYTQLFNMQPDSDAAKWAACCTPMRHR